MFEGDDLRSLKEVKESPEWPEWEHTVKAKLDQLQKTGTWSLVNDPDAVLIANKWVFY